MQSPKRLGSLVRFITLAITSCVGTAAYAERPPLIDASNLERSRSSDKPRPAPLEEKKADTGVDWTPGAPACVEPTGPWPSEEGALLEAPITVEERNEVALQIARCSRNVHLVADPWRVLALYRLEEQLGVPDAMRGIFGAIWCIEGGMRSQSARGGPIRGDLDERGRAMALGPFQGHGWLWQWCGLAPEAADDLYLAARCYWSRVADRHANIEGRCRKKDWVVAEALTANGRKYAREGCDAISGHVRELTAWRQWEKVQAIRNAR